MRPPTLKIGGGFNLYGSEGPSSSESLPPWQFASRLDEFLGESRDAAIGLYWQARGEISRVVDLEEQNHLSGNRRTPKWRLDQLSDAQLLVSRAKNEVRDAQSIFLVNKLLRLEDRLPQMIESLQEKKKTAKIANRK